MLEIVFCTLCFLEYCMLYSMLKIVHAYKRIQYSIENTIDRYLTFNSVHPESVSILYDEFFFSPWTRDFRRSKMGRHWAARGILGARSDWLRAC